MEICHRKQYALGLRSTGDGKYRGRLNAADGGYSILNNGEGRSVQGYSMPPLPFLLKFRHLKWIEMDLLVIFSLKALQSGPFPHERH